MSLIREFSCFDLFKFNKVNLDPLTETYGLSFYMSYQARWPEYFYTAEAPNGEIQGYIMGKAEGSDQAKQWHGHVTALTVQPNYRRLGLARKLMKILEDVSEKKNTWFVDLFVRENNTGNFYYFKYFLTNFKPPTNSIQIWGIRFTGPY